MDKSSPSVEEGPLSDQSFGNQNEDDEDSGLPLQYLLGVQDLEQEQFESRFYRLQVEDTAFSSLESSNPEPLNPEPGKQRLEVSTDDPPKLGGGIIFSPCGTQAVVYPIQHSSNLTENKRPATVGQSKEDTPTKQGPGSALTINNTEDSPIVRKVTTGLHLQVRLEDFKNSLDFATFSQDIPSSISSSTDPSPRRFRMAPKARERYLLQEPDNFYASVSEHDLTGESESVAGTPSPLITARSLAERANSPSVASVTSGYSAASSAPGGTARRHLEWDSGADLGYIGEKLVAQKDVAASLSTLEKMAIGNYSNFFRSEPEGKPSTSGQPPPPRLPGPDREEEMRKMRLESYANSLLRQTQRQQANAIQTSAAAFAKSSTSRVGPKNLPMNSECNDGTSPTKSKISQSSSPSRRRRSLNRPSVVPNTAKSLSKNERFHSPLRSASLTDLSSLVNRRGSDWFTKRQSPTQFRSEPSSSSSTATVVPIQPCPEPLENSILRAFGNMDPRSLPPSLQGLLSQDLQQLQNLSEYHFEGAPQWQIPGRASLTSLGSRYSQSRSFETVIRAPDSDSLDTEEELQLLRRPPNQPQNDEVHELPSTSRSAWTARSVARDPSRAQSLPKETNQSEQNNVLTNIWLQKRTMQESARTKMVERIPGQAWTTSNDETDGGLKRSHGTQTQQRDGSSRSGRRSVGTYTGRWSSRTHARNIDRGSSMPATTSEDDLQQLEVGGATGGRPRRRPSYPTNCSTLESAAHIDRAKSFEYIPGESFPLQENSSSYEYLPGHLVDDRPATAISANSADRKSPKKGFYTSEYITTEDTMSSHSSSSRPNDRGRQNLTTAEANLTAKELLDKSHELKSARSKNTKDFYRRLQKYIKFLSIPSQTPEDCRIKQEVASKVLSLIKTEEMKLFQCDQSIQEDAIPINPGVSSKESDSEPIVNTGASDTIDRGKWRPRKKSKTTFYHPPTEEAQNPPPEVQSLHTLLTGSISLPDDIEVQRMRVEQMRKLRKELRTLEKLERLRLNKAVGGPISVDEQLIRQLDDNSFDSVSTNLTEMSTAGRLNIEGQSASDTWTQSAPQTTPSTQKIKSDSFHNSESISREPLKRSSSRQSGKPSPKRVPGATRKTIKKITEDKKEGQVEFGQTFPSPRPTKEVLSVQTNSSQQIVQTSHDKKVLEEPKKIENRVFTIKRKPVAYYLPLSNQSPIIIGKRILRERSQEVSLGKENRSILANYMSALSLDSKPIIRKPPVSKVQVSCREETHQKISLQDALAECRPDLLRKFQERSRRLREMKLMRLEYEAEMRNWISANETLAEADRTPKPLPPCFERKIPHLFNYKNMVIETRRKYESLPEIRRQRLEARRRSNYRTNRLMANVFKRRLKTKVLKGHVSHAHSSRVI